MISSLIPEPVRILLRELGDKPPCARYAEENGWEEYDRHFFPGEDHPTSPYELTKIVDEIRGICIEECPVRYLCLEAGLANSYSSDAGVWGGLTHSERARLRQGLITVPQVDAGWRHRTGRAEARRGRLVK